jgi:hypothetical protein
LSGGDQTVFEDAGPQTVAWATGISSGPPNEAGQALVFDISTDNDGLFLSLPTVDAQSGQLAYTPATDLSGAATVSITLADSGGVLNGGNDTSAPAGFTIEVLAINDPPSFQPGPNQSFDSAAIGVQTVANWATGVDLGPQEVTQAMLGYLVAITADPAGILSQASVGLDGTLILTLTGEPGSAEVSVQIQDDGGIANGGIDTSPASILLVTVGAVPVPALSGWGFLLLAAAFGAFGLRRLIAVR